MSDETAAWMVEAQRVSRGILRRVLQHTLDNNGGYLSQACSAADSLAALYTHLMRLGPSEGPEIPLPFPGVPGPNNAVYTTGAAYNGPQSPELDRFFFSPVHYALVLYATLIETGRLGEHGLEQFNQDGSTVELIGAEHSPGHEVTAGSLAQCLSQAAGIAYARRRKGHTGHNWVFMSDGEFQEGQTWEAIAAMDFHGIDNVTVVVDANGQQCDGPMSAVGGVEPLADRLRAFGAVPVEADGHDLAALAEAAQTEHRGKPLVIIARTDPCRGIEKLRERAPKLHYVRFKGDAERAEYRRILEGMSWTS
jgi:transketolase